MSTTLEDTTTVRATRVRFKVVGFAVVLAMVTYLDRVCIANMAPQIRADLKLTEYQMSWIFSAFAIAYAFFEIPTASWADKIGTRRVLTRIVVWWSALTMATAGAWNFTSMLITRFLFGVGEAGAWPCVAATFSRWIPAKERGTVQGIFFAGAHLAGGLTPPLVVFLMNFLTWRQVFIVFGFVGLIWTVAWYLWYRDDPSEHPSVNQAELEAIVSGRRPPSAHGARWEYWKRLLTHRNTIALCLMYVGNSYAYYFCITWLPTYMQERHHIPKVSLGWAAGLPLMLSVFGDFCGGWLSDYLCKTYSPRVGRAGLGAAAYVFAAIAMFIAASSSNAYFAVGMLSISVAAVMFTLGAAWGTVLDIGGHHTAVVGATMNTAGQIGSIFSPLVAVFVKDHLGGWDAPLYVIAGLFLIGAIAWCFVDPRKEVFPHDEGQGFEPIISPPAYR